MLNFTQVRMAAFQTLGAFISTFANPAQTGLRLRENGVLEYDPTQLEKLVSLYFIYHQQILQCFSVCRVIFCSF